MINSRLVLSASCCALSLLLGGCGGGGGGSSDPNAVAFINFSTTYTSPGYSLAIADGADTVAVKAIVRRGDGAYVPDGTTVRFSTYSGAAVFGNTSTSQRLVIANGRATAILKHAAVSALTPQNRNGINVVVTPVAIAGGVEKKTKVKFINQPTAADVTVALTPAIGTPGISAFGFTVQNSAGADNSAATIANDVEALAFEAAPSNGTVAPIVTVLSPTQTRFSGIAFNAAGDGMTTAAGSPVFKLAYGVTAGQPLPSFAVVSDTGLSSLGFLLQDLNANDLIASPSPANFILTPRFDTE